MNSQSIGMTDSYYIPYEF